MARSSDITVSFKAKPGRQEIRQTAVNEVVNGPGVRKDLRRRAENVMKAQKRRVGVRSGRLRASIRIVDRGNRNLGAINIQVVAGRAGLTPYLGYHEYGTAAHVIEPKRAKTLRFTSGGQVVFARRVNHPGTKARRFIRDSTRYWRP